MTDQEAYDALLKIDEDFPKENYTDENGVFNSKALLKDSWNAFFERFGSEPAEGENPIITEHRENIYFGIYVSKRNEINVKDFIKEKRLRELYELYLNECETFNSLAEL